MRATVLGAARHCSPGVLAAEGTLFENADAPSRWALLQRLKSLGYFLP